MIWARGGWQTDDGYHIHRWEGSDGGWILNPELFGVVDVCRSLRSAVTEVLRRRAAGQTAR